MKIISYSKTSRATKSKVRAKGIFADFYLSFFVEARFVLLTKFCAISLQFIFSIDTLLHLVLCSICRQFDLLSYLLWEPSILSFMYNAKSRETGSFKCWNAKHMLFSASFSSASHYNEVKVDGSL